MFVSIEHRLGKESEYPIGATVVMESLSLGARCRSQHCGSLEMEGSSLQPHAPEEALGGGTGT